MSAASWLGVPGRLWFALGVLRSEIFMFLNSTPVPVRPNVQLLAFCVGGALAMPSSRLTVNTNSQDREQELAAGVLICTTSGYRTRSE